MIHETDGVPIDPDRRYWRRRANRKVRTARRARTLARWTWVAALNLAVVALLVYSGGRALRHLTTSPEFSLRVVSVDGGSAATAARVRSALEGLRGQNLPELDLDRVIALVRRDPWVLDCTVKRIFPHTLRVSVTEREPWVRARIAGRDWLVDRSGTLIAAIEPGAAEELPLLTGLEHVAESERPEALRHGADAVWTLRQRAASWVETVAALDLSRRDRISVVTGEPAITVLLDPARADRNLSEYLALQDDLLDRIGPVSYVDLRWRDRISLMPNGVSDAQE